MNGMTRWAGRLVGAALVLGGATAVAQPSLVPLQGYLTDDIGQPIDGQLPAVFTVYDAAAAGTALHTETLDCADPPNDCLTISDGHFIVHLGALDALDLAIFAGDDSVYVEVEIDSEPLTPRMALETVPFAAYAGYAGSTPWDGLTDVPADIADGDDDTTYATTSPLVLDVADNTIGLSSAGCTDGDGWVWNGAAWACEPAAGEPYSAGNGVAIDPVTRTISQNATTCAAGQVSRWTGTAWTCVTDQTGIAALEAGPGIGVVGSRISTAAPTCAAGQFSRWNGSAWICADDDTGTDITGGAGVAVAAGEVSIDSPTCAAGQVSRWNGSAWVCATDQQGVESISAGAGIGIVGTTISTAAPTCLPTQYSRWNGSAWTCVADVSTAVTGGNGINVAGGAVSIDSPSCAAGQVSRWTGTSWACVTDQGIRTLSPGAGIGVSGNQISIASPGCTASQYSRWNGSAWTCVADVSTAYAPGNGISITGGTIATQSPTCAAGQVSRWTGSAWSCVTDAGFTSLVAGGGIGVSGNQVSIAAPTCGPSQYSRWTGSAWACADDVSVEVTAGSGIAVSAAGVVSTVATTCGAGQYAYWNGTTWLCRTDQQGLTSIVAGGGIGVSGNQVSIASPTCGATQYSRWTGAGWTCANDASTTYTSGPGLTLSGGQFSISSPGCSGSQFSRWTGSAWVCGTDRQGLTSIVAGGGIGVSGNQVSIAAPTCGANQYSRWTGSSWTCANDLSASYTAGDGLQLVGGSRFQISAPGCSSSQYSRWTGSAWICATDNRGITGVASGAAITVTGGATRTVSLSSGGCAANEVWQWTGAVWDCRVVVDAGNGLAMSSNRNLSVRTGAGLRLASDLVQVNAPVCTGNNALRWTGSSFSCESDRQGVTSLSAGAGITVGGGAAPSVALSTAGCGTNEVWQWNGSSWQCQPAVAAGNGLSISGNRTLNVNAGPGLTLASDRVQVSSPSCSASQASRWTGSSWTCVDVSAGGGGVAAGDACYQIARYDTTRRISHYYNGADSYAQIRFFNQAGSVVANVKTRGQNRSAATDYYNVTPGRWSFGYRFYRRYYTYSCGWNGWSTCGAYVNYDDIYARVNYADEYSGGQLYAFSRRMYYYHSEYRRYFDVAQARYPGGGGTSNCAPAGEQQRIVHGVVDPNGNIYGGQGFMVYRRGTGEFVLEYPSFRRNPSGVVQAIYPSPTYNGRYGVPYVANFTRLQRTSAVVATGTYSGSLQNRWFSFIIVGSD